ncbi:MAG TPA: polysaccharide deacetylase family protein, partial [Spirochaetota bacterium]|nr:polysaccharide deacetylase family protein [Spirochaetota bacterium]
MDNLLKGLYITIDTEPDCDIRWRRSNPLTFTSITEGIPKLLRPIWDKYNINPIYFVSPAVLEDDESCLVLKDEAQNGAIIGAHLHSEEINPEKIDIAGKSSSEYPCYACSYETEYEKLKNLTELIEKKIGVRPIWYRAARYGADLDTIRILAELGYKYDSSITPEIDWSKQGGPDHSKAPLGPYWISKDDFYKSSDEKDSIGIIEVPITITGKRLGILGNILPNKWLFYNWIRPTHMFVWEQKKMIKQLLKKSKISVIVMMFHSMEIMINKTPFVRNKWMQK